MKALEFEHVDFAYADGTPVLNDASFSVEEGELVALVGNNGSGKSTVARLADAFLLPASGDVRLFGRSVRDAASRGEGAIMEMRREVGFVFQNPDDQLVAPTVVDEVAFGPSNLGLPREEVIERTEDALGAVGMLEHVGRDVNALSGGMKQRVALADALAMKPRLLILDEATSMLDPEGRHDVAAIVERLHAGGMSVLLITHDPEEASIADRVLEVHGGKITEAQLDVIAVSAAKERERLFERAKAASSPGAPVVSFDGVSFAYTSKDTWSFDVLASAQEPIEVLSGTNLEAREGELLCLKGSNGSGKSTVLKLMNGLLQPTFGTVSVLGRATTGKDGANAARRAVGLCFQYPERSFFAQSVYDEVAYGPRSAGLDDAEVEARVRDAMESMALGFEEYSKRSPFELSGGEQRKVSIASVLSMRPTVLAMDEPCASLDLPSHVHLLELILDLKASGQTIVMATHDEGDIALLADRVFEL